MFQMVISAYIVTDLIFALVFAYLFVKVGSALGVGILAGVALVMFIAILSPVIGNIYHYFGVTYVPAGLVVAESISRVVAHAIEGAATGAIDRT